MADTKLSEKWPAEVRERVWRLITETKAKTERSLGGLKNTDSDYYLAHVLTIKECDEMLSAFTRALTPAQQAAEEMVEALRAYEVLDDFHANCEECGDFALPPELCEMCFPYADDARLKMRAALAKAGKP